MLDQYSRTGTDMARRLFRYGNPLSWPAAWAFAWRTGAPASKYDEAVGPLILDGFAPAHKGDAPSSIKGEIAFAAGSGEPFMVSGFAAAKKVGAERVRPMVAPHARFLAPLNVITGVSLRLAGTASVDGRLRVRWNGEELASAAIAAAAPLDVAVEVPEASVRRGLNIVDLDVDGAPAGAEAALLTKAIFEAKLPEWK
jgi:hypothetical protein